jgi:hypothetical protein
MAAGLATLVMLLMPLAWAPAAYASCAADPQALTYEEMIDQRTTGSEPYPIMALGIVVEIKDLWGREGGPTVARVAVAEHPIGYTPLIARVRFTRDYPGVSASDQINFFKGERVVLVARRLAGGRFESDGPCGQTGSLSRARYRALLALARS